MGCEAVRHRDAEHAISRSARTDRDPAALPRSGRCRRCHRRRSGDLVVPPGRTRRPRCVRSDRLLSSGQRKHNHASGHRPNRFADSGGPTNVGHSDAVSVSFHATRGAADRGQYTGSRRCRPGRGDRSGDGQSATPRRDRRARVEGHRRDHQLDRLGPRHQWRCRQPLRRPTARTRDPAVRSARVAFP